MSNPNPSLITDEMWRLWTDRPNPAWELSGIYANKKGYHNTVKANLEHWPGNYSIQLPLDLVAKNRDKSRAIDLTMSDKEMVKWTTRMRDSAMDLADHRLAAVKEFYGTLDNKTVFGLTKSNQNGPWRRSSADLTHLWHGHTSIFTLFVDNWTMLAPILSVWKGESLTDWNRRNMEMKIAELNDTGEVVRYWQQLHNRVRNTVSPPSPAISVDGNYGPASAAAFLDFWKKCGGSGTTYKGTYITGWLALQYHTSLVGVSTPDKPLPFPDDKLREIVKQKFDEYIAGKRLVITGELEGYVTPQ